MDGCGADAELVGLAKQCLAIEPNDRLAAGRAVAEQVSAYRAGVAERLRKAELERTAAEVRAVEERRRRRVQLGLAAAVLLLLVGAGGGAWWWQQQRAATLARQHEAERRVQLALDDARDRLDDARRTGQAARYPEAKASLDKAREVARTSQVHGRDDDIDAPEQRWQTEMTAADRSQRLLTACLDVRQPQEVKRYQRNEAGLMAALAEPTADEQFATAFKAWDADFDVSRTEDALKRLQALPEPVVQELVAALDEWWQTRRAARPPGDWRAVHDLADRLDTNESRRELRALLMSGALEQERRTAEVVSVVQPLSRLLVAGPLGSDALLGAAILAAPPVPRQIGLAVGERARLRELAGRLDHHKEPVLTILAVARALTRSGAAEEAIAVLRAAGVARPGEVVLLMELGWLLERQRPARFTEAVECYRAARAIRPDLGVALAKALSAAGRAAEGEAVLRELMRRQPRNPELHRLVGYILFDMNDLARAAAEYREAIRLKPDYAEAHTKLGSVLCQQGQFDACLAALRRGHELGMRTPGWRYPSADWVRIAERRVELDRRLPDVRAGNAAPATTAERLEFAMLCGHSARRFYVAAARLAADLRQEHRYHAARCFALAGAGQAEDGKDLPDRVVVGLRWQSLLYLRADLAAYTKFAESDQAAVKEAVRQRLTHWRQDTDLASVRDAIDRLPETERAAWRSLWQDVEAVRKRAAEK